MLVKKERILAAALTVFYETGYDLATIDMVAEKAGMARRTIYGYFKNLEEIFYAVYLDGLQKRVACMSETEFNALNGLERLRFFGERYLDFYLINPAYLKMQIYLEYRDDMKDNQNKDFMQFHEANMQLSNLLLSTFELGIRDGSIRKDLNTFHFFHYYAISLRSLANQVLAGNRSNNINPFFTREYYLNFLELFLQMIKA